MEKEIDLLEIFRILMRKLWIIVLCAVIGGIVAFALSAFVLTPQYESYTTLYVRNYDAGYTQQENNSIEQGDLNTSRSLVDTYSTVLKSDSLMREVTEELTKVVPEDKLSETFSVGDDGKVNFKAVKSSFSIAAVENTEVMRITATTIDPEVSAELCKIIANKAPEFLVRVVGAGSAEIIDEAVVNKNPVSPNIPRNSLLGMLLGILLSCAVILLKAFIDDTVKDKEEISEKFDKPILGEIQRIGSSKDSNKRTSGESNKLMTDPAMPFNVSESYKTLRTNILFALGTSGKKSLAISSVNPAEGKSTTAANTAIAFAQTGSKVLLIDADMRKPVQHQTFKVRNSEGLSTLIVRMSEVENCIKKTEVDGLDLLPSGPIPPNPSELLASERFAELMEQFEKQYDYIILDTPPINVVTDAMVMNDRISGILLVVRYSSTKMQDITDCMNRLEFAEANMMGFVLNDIQTKTGFAYYRKKKGGYGYGEYGYGYGYGYGYDKQAREEAGITRLEPTSTEGGDNDVN